VSGIVGILRRDGGRARATLLDRMLQALVHRGPDGSGTWLDGPVALGFLAHHTTPESVRERQPLADASGHCRVVFDGRLDNRDDLIAALGDREPGAPPGDAALVLRAYRKWGEGLAEHLVGDFALAVWDSAARTLVCARDPLGIRPFYYHADHAGIRWASEPRALFEDAAIARQVNEGYLGELLAAEPIRLDETLLAGIMRLPRAHVLVVGPHGVRTRRYWDPCPQTLGDGLDEVYGDRVREALDLAVRSRLRTTGPIGAHLSGGLDSSCVVGSAVSVLRADRAPAASFETFSLVFPGRPYDERPFIDAVSDFWRIPGHLVTPARPSADALWASIDRTWDLPDPPTGECLMQPLFDAARRRGVTVMLTGVGGDQWFGGSAFYYADLIRRGHWLTLARQLRAADPDSELAWTVGDVVRGGLFPLLPRPLRRMGRRVLRRRAVPRWIAPRFARRIGLEARLQAPQLEPSHGGYAASDLRRLLMSGWEAMTIEQMERAAAWHGVELRHPFHDRRLVELALALPEDQRQRSPYTKIALRAAARDRVPDLVRTRRSKVDVGEIFLQAIRAGSPAAVEAPSLEAAGFVDGGVVRAMGQEAFDRAGRGDPAYGALMTPLWMILSVDRWFREIIEARPVHDPVKTRR
jgi:asparagine synthase (glutamine-hydrolysing)